MQAKQTTTERQPYSVRKAIEAVKGTVPIEQVAREYTALRLAGTGRLLGRCIAPDHTDKTPSLTIFTNTQRFKCFGCHLTGDVVDLEEIGGKHVEAWTAVVALAERYGVELPRRPERWHKWQNEKHRRRRMVHDALTAAYQRRFFRVYGGYLEDIGDPGEREAEARMLFDDLRTLALAAAEHRMSR